MAQYPTPAHRDHAKDAVLAALSDVVTVAPPEEQPLPSIPNSSAAAYGNGRQGGSSRVPGSSPLNPAYHVDGGGGTPPVVPGKDTDLIDISGAGPSVPSKKSSGSGGGGGLGGKIANAFKRSTTDEKEAKRKAKEQRMQDEINRSSAKNSRIDVIDRLDLTGIHGASMFHHDSPYDAVSAHRNIGKRAPVLAFDRNVDQMTGQPIGGGAGPSGSNGSRQNLSPLAQATLARMDSDGKKGGNGDGSSYAVPTLGMHDSSSHAYEPPEASHPNAEIWGVTAEPWQDFAQPKAPALYADARRSSSSTGTSGLSPHVDDGRTGHDSSASSVLDMEAIMTGNTSGAAPRAPEYHGNADLQGSASPFPERNWGDPNVKRSKSLIKRIRSVRQSPNVPMLDEPDDAGDLPPGQSRRGRTHKYSPSSPPLTRAVTDGGVGPAVARSHGLAGPQDGGEARFNSFAQASAEALQTDARAPAGAAGLGAGGAQVKRSGSVFNRFGRGKSRSPVQA